MGNKIAIIGAHGIGDNILAHQAGHFVKQAGNDVDIFCASRDEVFEPLKFLFPYVKQLPAAWGDNNAFLSGADADFLLQYPDYDKIYYILPDLLYHNTKYKFDWEKYAHPQIIRQTRLLHYGRQTDTSIYIGLNTTTRGYDYQFAYEFIYSLATKLPNYKIIYPLLDKWAGINIDRPNTIDFPRNVEIQSNPDFISSLKDLRRCEYLVCTDNGISHIGYQYGIPRLLLDPQFRRPPWEARWREDMTESVPISIPPLLAATIVESNIRCVQSTLIDRKYLNSINMQDFNSLLLLKEK